MQKPNKTTTIIARPSSKSKLKPYQYDRTFILAELKDMLDELAAHEEYRSKSQLFKNRPYSYDRFNRWKDKYRDNLNIRECIKKIEEVLESRLVEQGLAGKSIPMTIFLLKNYYGYTDQYQHRVDETVTFKVTRGRAPIEAEVVPLKTIPTKRPS